MSFSRLILPTQQSIFFTTAICSLSILAAANASAADDPRFSLSVGAFITDRGSEARLDVVDGENGTVVDLENDLGADKSDTVFRLDGFYRFNNKHRIDFSVFDLSQTATMQIDKEINWQGTIFPVGATVDSDIEFEVYKLAYTYSIMRRENGYLGLSAGLYIADIGAHLSAEGIAENEGGAVTAPLPVIGLRGEYQFAEKWKFRASGEFFSLSYEGYDGTLTDFYAGVDDQLMENMAIGVGINSVSLDVGIEDDSLNGNLDWRYDGGLVFLKFDF